MRYDERGDGELLALARQGWEPAFAVLVHRHAPRVLASAPPGTDANAHAVATFTAAMRSLQDRDPGAPVGPWIQELTGRPAPAQVPPVDPATIDDLWHALHRRWPDGRVHHAWPRALTGGMVALAAVAVGVAVPLAILSAPSADDDDVLELRAQPLAAEERPEPEPEELEELEPLPSFEFPDVEPDPEPAPAPAPAPTPEPEPAPAPPPEPEPEPDPIDEEPDLGDEDPDAGEDVPDEPVDEPTPPDQDEEGGQALPILRGDE